jgi:regulator of CtrA degradation
MLALRANGRDKGGSGARQLTDSARDMGSEDHSERAGGSAADAINLSERFAFSARFKTLFKDGMALVEESATYLDSRGRVAARSLPRPAALLYGAESMRLTTRLMQLASWLLLQRAASEGEMTREQLLDEKKKVRLETLPKSTHGQGWDMLPTEFVELVARSIALQNRIMTLDGEIYGDQKPAVLDPGDNPVNQQINLLSTAFGATRKR